MTENKKTDLEYLFKPRSVAVVGASHNKEKIGYKILENIISGGYSGKIYPVNPEGGEILKNKVYKTVAEIEDEIDLAFIVIPAKYVFDAVKACADKKTKYAAIISSGFSEVGDIETEKKIVSFALEHGMRVIGPNIFGVYIAESSLNGTFGVKDLLKGGIAIITQSGALGISIMGRTAVEKIGLSAMFSLGNKSDIDEADLLEYLIDDEKTKVIMMYVEGIKKGERLVFSLKKATRKKPVVVLKAGRSKRGAMAAASHTGSLAGADNVFTDIVKQCGVIRAENINEALDWCKFLANTPQPTGENTVIITNGGGMGVMAADACEKYQVNLLDDAETLKNTFSNVVPSFGSLKNPVDLTGQATLEQYREAIYAALKNKDIHSIICLGCETAFFDAVKLAAIIKDLYETNKPNKPIVFSFFGGAKIDECINTLREANIPAYSEVYEAVSCLGALYANYRNTRYGGTEGEIIEADIDDKSVEEVIEAARREGRNFLLPYEAEKIMSAAKIRTPKTYIAKNIEESVEYAEKIGYPVVMKVVSKDIIHKSDAGGVAVNLENKKEVLDAYQAILYNCRKHNPNAKIEGIQVSEMIDCEVEVIVGAVRDKSFGPIVMYGLGGVYVEVMGDVAFRSYPLSRAETLNMINETKSSKLLAGVRGTKRRDINAVVDVIQKLGAVLRNHPQISDIEVNPLIVFEEGRGVAALDVRILLSETETKK